MTDRGARPWAASSPVTATRWTGYGPTTDTQACESDLKDRPWGPSSAGSLSVVDALIALDVVDDYHLLVHPTALRAGKPLFRTGPPQLDLHAVGARAFSSGVTLMTFRPVTDQPA